MIRFESTININSEIVKRDDEFADLPVYGQRVWTDEKRFTQDCVAVWHIRRKVWRLYGSVLGGRYELDGQD